MALLQYLKLHRLIADDAPLDRANQVHLLTDARPSVGELGMLLDEVQIPALAPGPNAYNDRRPACPKQADLAPQTLTFQHTCFQATRPSQLIDGNLVALVHDAGVPTQVVQYRAQSLWSSTGSQEYGSVVSLVYTLTSIGIDTLAATR